ncbi:MULTISPECIES: agmatinase family protein [Sphingobacterium]|uniref:Agmatinase family protein n=1 Tax=Sphingobacterium anhuiense TaxID=493780 RepID=A0ABW5YZ93_9SPHI|nr:MULTISPECIES: agmatinase family protein [unclassified Sphingobacterium]MBB2952122.1 agmatinase [Sphingobacterium sp. JUb56]NJI75913.1 agmatinase family protein [Sphingobacterium sp. B16(2022)]
MSTKQTKIENFDPSQPGLPDSSIYGLPFTAEESDIIVVPAPWEVTVSYGSGASNGPDAILNASFQVDLLHQEFPDLWKLGIFMDETPAHWSENSEKYKSLAQPIIEALENGEDIENDVTLRGYLEEINKASKQFNDEVKERSLYWMNKGKKVILLGGDHSTPLGYYEALAENHDSFGILHFDAHMDLRNAYEGFTYSHASIMFNAIKLPQLEKIVQVGIRDFSEGELEAVQTSNKVKVFTDTDLKANSFEGKIWKDQCDEILAQLPENVAVSFDIDALQRWYCPNTGTPVPGGLSYEQATYLLSRLANSDKNIIGIDLVEVAPGEDDWDGNVGARLLFHLCGVFAKNNKLAVGSKINF